MSKSARIQRGRGLCRRKARQPRGWALVAIMTVSMFATMFLFSLAGLSASLLQTEGAARQRSYALAGAEAGVDFVRMKLNESLASNIDADVAPAPGEASRDYGLPVQYIPQLGNRCRVMIRVSRIDNDLLTLLFQQNFPILAPENNSSRRLDPSLWVPSETDWRRFTVPDEELAPNGAYAWKVEVTSYCGIFATSIRTIMVAQNPEGSGGFAPGDRAYSPGAITATSLDLGSGSGDLAIQSTGNLDSADQTYVSQNANPDDPTTNDMKSFKAALRTNGTMRTEAGTKVYGDVQFTTPQGTTGTRLVGSDESTIYGRVIANSDAPVSENLVYRDGPSAPGTDNVQANADQFPSVPTNRIGTDPQSASGNQMPVYYDPASPTPPMTPFPMQVPSDTFSLPAFPTTPPDGMSGVPPVPVPAGNSYVTSSFSSDGATGQLVFNQVGDGPTKIFVTDGMSAFSDSADLPAIDINSRFLSNVGLPSNLQIFYSGNRPVKLSLDGGSAKLAMVVFAPNADVSTSGDGEFTGALVGKSLSINHSGSFKLDPASADALVSKSSSNDPSTPGFVPPKPSHYVVLSWQQLSGQLVPLD